MISEKLSVSTARGCLKQVLKYILPPGCAFCGAVMRDYNQCCTSCLGKIKVYPSAHCNHCGVLLLDESQSQCGRCMQKPPGQSETRSLFTYDACVREAILAWKLSGKEQSVRWLIKSAEPVLRSLLGEKDVLLPVPMPLSRMRKVGQHHSANLARWIADITDSMWHWEWLERTKDIPRQSSLTGAARRKNIRGAFAVCQSFKTFMQGKRIWVVDDIITTGATVNEAARILKKEGADVSVLTLSRVVRS